MNTLAAGGTSFGNCGSVARAFLKAGGHSLQEVRYVLVVVVVIIVVIVVDFDAVVIRLTFCLKMHCHPLHTDVSSESSQLGQCTTFMNYLS